MPIYAYRCESCGFAKDVLQKMSDPRLTECPECHKPTFTKQVTAAGFQLKGTGWYVTDFRDNGKGKSDSATGVSAKSGDAGDTNSKDSTAASGAGESGGGDGAAGSASAAAPAAPAPSAAPATSPAPSSGSSSSSGTSGS